MKSGLAAIARSAGGEGGRVSRRGVAAVLAAALFGAGPGVGCKGGGGGGVTVVAGAPAGDVTEAAGDVQATRDGKTRAIKVGDVIAGDDVIKTGADGRITIVLRHNQVPWSLGPNKEKKVADSAAWAAARGASAESVSDDRSAAAGRHAERSASETGASVTATPPSTESANAAPAAAAAAAPAPAAEAAPAAAAPAAAAAAPVPVAPAASAGEAAPVAAAAPARSAAAPAPEPPPPPPPSAKAEPAPDRKPSALAPGGGHIPTSGNDGVADLLDDPSGGGGLGLRGTGEGGGGIGDSGGGLGSIGTRGRGTGGGGAGAPSRASSPHGRVTLGAFGVTGALDPTAAQAVVRTRLAQLRACYERALQANPALAGLLSITLSVKADGTVTSASVDGVADLDTTRACARARLLSIKFPTASATSTVTAKAVLAPDGK